MTQQNKLVTTSQTAGLEDPAPPVLASFVFKPPGHYKIAGETVTKESLCCKIAMQMCKCHIHTCGAVLAFFSLLNLSLLDLGVSSSESDEILIGVASPSEEFISSSPTSANTSPHFTNLLKI